VNERDGTLGAALRTAQAMNEDGAEVTLGFGFKFHREWVNDLPNRRLVEDVFSETLGAQVRVRCVAAAAARAESPPTLESVLQDPYIRQALKLFGGQPAELE
jgi:hypothetical protein